MRAPTIGTPVIHKLIRALIFLMKLATEFPRRSGAPALIGYVPKSLATEKLSRQGDNVCKNKKKPERNMLRGTFPTGSENSAMSEGEPFWLVIRLTARTYFW